jgi:dihydroneopterin aldolase
MVFYGYHGVLPEERTLGQRFVVDVEARADLRRAAATDDLDDTVNYVQIYRAAEEIVTGTPCTLIEAVAGRIAERVLREQPLVESVVVRVRKPGVPIAGSALGSSEVVLERARGAA